jgi:hypothetical protein
MMHSAVSARNLDSAFGRHPIGKSTPANSNRKCSSVECSSTLSTGQLFRGADGSFLLHMSSEGQTLAEERIVWLSVRDAISCLNEEPDQYGSLWEIAQVVPAVGMRHLGDVKDFLGISFRA